MGRKVHPLESQGWLQKLLLNIRHNGDRMERLFVVWFGKASISMTNQLC